MEKKLEDLRREGSRLTEVVLEKDDDIKKLLEGGGNFQLIKNLL